MPGKSKKGGGLESTPVYKKTPFTLRSGNAPLKQNIFAKKKGYKSKSIRSGLESVFGGVQSEITNLASKVSDASKKDVPREIVEAVNKKASNKKKSVKKADPTTYAYWRGSGMSNFEKRQEMRKAARKA